MRRKEWQGKLFRIDCNPPPTATSRKRIGLNWFNLVFDFSLPRSILFSDKLNSFSPSRDCFVCNSNWYAISLPLSHPTYFPILFSPPIPLRGWMGTWLLARAKPPQPQGHSLSCLLSHCNVHYLFTSFLSLTPPLHPNL